MIVKDVKFIKGMVEIVLEKESFQISKDNYIENPITIDSDISQSKKNELLEYEIVIKSKAELIKLLNKKAFSEFEIYNKLKKKMISDLYIKKIVDDLKRAGLINDEFVAYINVEGLMLKRKGKLEIEKVLREKRIDDEIIEKAVNGIDVKDYISNFNRVVLKYCKMYENKSFVIKENLIKNKLKELGYEESLIATIDINKDNEKEYELVKKNIFKIIRNKENDFRHHENINKIKLKLAAKGFSYDIINKALEEVVESETN